MYIVQYTYRVSKKSVRSIVSCKIVQINLKNVIELQFTMEKIRQIVFSKYTILNIMLVYKILDQRIKAVEYSIIICN